MKTSSGVEDVGVFLAALLIVLSGILVLAPLPSHAATCTSTCSGGTTVHCAGDIVCCYTNMGCVSNADEDNFGTCPEFVGPIEPCWWLEE